MDNKEIIEKTLEEISKDVDWETRYAKYAKDILMHEVHHKELSKNAKVKFPLSKYTSITKFKGRKLETDIRFLGESIGSLIIKDGSSFFKKRLAVMRVFFFASVCRCRRKNYFKEYFQEAASRTRQRRR